MGKEDLVITVPRLFRCPISLDVMKSPVSLSTGVTYDRSSIQRWLDNGNNTCPATMQVLQSKDFIPNYTLQRLIQIWLKSANLSSNHDEPAETPFSNAKILEFVAEIEKTPTKRYDNVPKLARFAQESENNLKFLCRINRFVPAMIDVLAGIDNEHISSAEEVVRILHRITKLLERKEEIVRLLIRNDQNNQRCLKSMLLVFRNGNAESRIACANLLESTAISAESMLRIAETEGLLREMLVHIGEKTDPATIEAVLSCLIAVATPKRVRSELVLLEGVKILGKLLSTSDLSSSVAEKVLKLLEMVVACKEGRIEICNDERCVSVILQKVLKVSNAASEHAVMILWSLCYLFRNQKAQETVAKNNGLTMFLLLIQSNCSPDARRMAGDLLKIFRVNCKSCLTNYDTNTSHIMPF